MAAQTIVGMTKTVANFERRLIFFEAVEYCYNYVTGQWTGISAYDGLGMYSVNSSTIDIGLAIFDSGSVDLQSQRVGSTRTQTAKITTAAANPNQGGRGVVEGVRPRSNGGTHAVRVGVQDSIDGAVTWSTSMAVHSRTLMADFRSEGRYVRVEDTITGDLTTAIGADVEFSAQGKV